ncbi:Protein-L-isoaspartate O-methyltransferase [Afipia felis]|uniref:Protein-L-isoaspartate O-methyltransferase n=3 Tax=Afipia felis TaxID=1035 RepID=A0A380W7Q1_AFIFE|nr:protein-L-isoaspartate O-methyltransferase [Afipia felis ATCC 53690]SUU76830.1 Protein-L-isoaspartate O-methyltransferase [Afipia felis]SUU84896.1 Protein-L-isoaspartate O-methyltransferase [Afipia felis]
MMAASGQSGREKLNFQLTLRRRGISDQAILRALEDVPRDLFVDPRDREFAYADTALGIACGQTISQPYVVAYMTEQLRTHPRHRVLEIGTGSGYQAAVLSRLCRIVVTVERYRTLVDTARRRFSSLGYNNIEVVFGDGYDVAQTLGMFDRIIVTAAMEEIPESLMELLEPGGILIAPVGPQGGAQQLVRLRKTEEGIARDELIPVRFVPALKGLAKEL